MPTYENEPSCLGDIQGDRECMEDFLSALSLPKLKAKKLRAILESEYAAKFDVTVEEAAEMWQYGFDSARDLCSEGWGAAGDLSLLEHLETLVS